MDKNKRSSDFNDNCATIPNFRVCARSLKEHHLLIN